MKKNAEKFKGTGVAIITPFKKSGAIDFDAYGNLVDNIIKKGVNFIVALGTTGEASTLSKREKAALIDFSVKTINNRVPLVIGIGGNSTSEVVSQVHSTLFSGVDGILSVCPYYNKPSQEGLYQHFKTVSEASPVSIILYTVPGRTASNLTATTTIRLANDFQNIVGIKEASGNFDQIFQVLKNRPDGFLVLSGDDGITLPLIASGCDGVISVVANIFPGEFSKMVKSAMEGDFISARRIHFQLIDLINSLFADGSPAGIKAALSIKNQCLELLRLPLVPVSREVYQLIERLIYELKS